MDVLIAILTQIVDERETPEIYKDPLDVYFPGKVVVHYHGIEGCHLIPCDDVPKAVDLVQSLGYQFASIAGPTTRGLGESAPRHVGRIILDYITHGDEIFV